MKNHDRPVEPMAEDSFNAAIKLDSCGRGEPACEGLIDEELFLQQLVNDHQVQQFMIRRWIDEDEVITGFYRCQFESGQQRSAIHIPFVPPLDFLPSIEIDLLGDDECRFRIGELQKFGVRIEMTLPRPSKQSVSIPLSFQVFNQNSNEHD